ncbi:2-dehydropantoate 2-reductase [cf. Phormidesmis sp. LEGE 11477]|nr:2-dehydropantoate 2-reductase [cf. Phormidesmis sp. LEGE 11477]
MVLPQISTVTALGALEPAGELVNVTPPTSVQESRIGELRVNEGDRIEAGQVIAVLDNRDRLQAALSRAEQQVGVARAQQSQIEAGAKSGEIQAQQAEIARIEASQVGDVATQQATIARLEAEVNNAHADFERYDSLYQRGGISASERDARRLTLTTAEQRLAEAIAALSRIQTTSQQQISQAQATLDRIEDVRPVDVSAARAEVKAAAAAVTEAGVITHVEGDRFPIGELDGSTSDRVQQLHDLLVEGGFRSRILDDIRSEIWLKAWGNLSFNPISALTHATLEDICRFAQTRDLAATMMAEAQAIGEKLGVTFRHTIEKRIAGAESVGRHKTSMLQDVEAGRSLETEALIGSILEMGRLTDTPAPAIEAVYACVMLLNRTMTLEGSGVKMVSAA